MLSTYRFSEFGFHAKVSDGDDEDEDGDFILQFVGTRIPPVATKDDKSSDIRKQAENGKRNNCSEA